MSFEMDFNLFSRGLNLADANIRKAAESGVALAGIRLRRDSVMEVPKVPLDEGTLRGSGSVFVNGVLKETAPNVGGNPTPADTCNEGFDADSITALVGYNTPYAERLHEHPEFHFGITRARKNMRKLGKRARAQRGPNALEADAAAFGTGAKYLERPLSQNRERYMGIAAAEIERAMGRGGNA